MLPFPCHGLEARLAQRPRPVLPYRAVVLKEVLNEKIAIGLASVNREGWVKGNLVRGSICDHGTSVLIPFGEAEVFCYPAMENLAWASRTRRKENIPPLFGHCRTPKQRSFQKNVKADISLSAARPLRGSDSALRRSTRAGAAPQGESQVSSFGKSADEPHRTGRVQSNLSCPYWPLRGTSGRSSCQKQSNLKGKLQRCGAENVAQVRDPHPLPAGLRSCSSQLGWKRPPLENVSYGPHGALPTRQAFSDICLPDRDPRAIEEPLGHNSGLRRNTRDLGHRADGFLPSKLSEISPSGSFLCKHHPSLGCPDRSAGSSPPGPTLTLAHLDLPKHPSEGFQALVRSSRTSAELHGSLRRLERELAMGALGSSPWDSRPRQPYKPSGRPWISATGMPSLVEHLAVEQSCAKHAGAKWHASFRGDWGAGPGSNRTGEKDGVPVLTGFRGVGMYGSGREAPDACCPTGFYSPVGPALFDQGEDPSSVSFSLEPGSLRHWAPDRRKRTRSDPKSSSSEKVLGPEEVSIGILPSSKGGVENLPSGPLSMEDLEVSLRTLGAKAAVDVGVSLYGTPREAPVRIGSLGGLEVIPAQWFQHCPRVPGVGEPQGEPGEAGGDPCLANLVGDSCLSWAPRRHSLFGPAAQKEFGEWLLTSDSRNPVAPVDPTAGTAGDASNSACRHPRAGEGSGPKQEGSLRKSQPKEVRSACKERHPNLGAPQEEDLGKEDRPMDEKRDRVLAQRSSPVLARSFLAWRAHVLEKKAMARGLYERQLLRKGLSALQWAVELRNVMVGIAQRSHALTVLATSFRKWQDAATDQRTRPLREEAACGPGFSALPGRDGFKKHALLTRLSRNHQEDAARYSRAEVGLWMQFRRAQGADELCRKVEAVRDMRRLAAAFRLWCLQKERLDREEARARDAYAILQKKNLAGVFWKWHSRYRASRQIWQVVARIQRGLISRCFDAWKQFTDRELLTRQTLEGLRARSLQRCFHQWTQMVCIREEARRLLVQFMAMKQKKSHEKLDLAANTTILQACVDVGKWSRRNGSSPLEGLLCTLNLQKAFLVWKTRWWESHLASVFRRALTQRQLRDMLAFWWWKTLCLEPQGLNAGSDLTEDSLLASLGSEASSLSSGFHSAVPALPTSRGSLEKEGSLEDTSQASMSSLTTADDSEPVLCHVSPAPGWSPDLGCLPDAGADSPSQTSSPPRGPQAGALISGSVASALDAARQEVVLRFRRARQRRLLASCFGKWETALQRARQRRQDERVRGRPVPGMYGAAQRWRKATRGYRLLRFSLVNQAGSYWTRASVVRLCSRQRCSHVGSRKLRKVILAWSSRRRWSPKEFLDPSDLPSSFRVWLAVYRCQGRAQMGQPLPESPQASRRPSGWDRAVEKDHEEAGSAVSRRLWLGRKYWGVWRRHVLLRQFRSARDARHLANSWLCWKDASRTKLLIRVLARRRLADWTWRTWRRRCLRSWVAERFRAVQQRRSLEKAFGKWRLRLAQKAKEALSRPRGMLF